MSRKLHKIKTHRYVMECKRCLKSSQVRLCLQVTSSWLFPLKFSIVPMVIVPLMGRIGLEPVGLQPILIKMFIIDTIFNFVGDFYTVILREETF